MTGNTINEHHLHTRKRIYQNLEDYPHTNNKISFLDKIIYIIGIISPIITMIQAYQIWISKNASNISFLTWSWYFFSSLIWLIYSIIHKEKPLILTNILWMIVSLIVIIEIIIFN